MADVEALSPEEMAEICGFQWRDNTPFHAVAVFREFDENRAMFDLFSMGHCIHENFMGCAPAYHRHLEEMITHPYWRAGIIEADFAVGVVIAGGAPVGLVHYSLMLAHRPNREIGPLGWRR